MNILIAIIVSIIPILILLKVIYEMGEVKKQPWWILLILFGFGILSWVLVKVVANLLGNDIYKSQMEVATLIGDSGFFLISFGIIAIIEELSKFLIINVMCFKNKYFKNPYDAIMYATCISLGFAFIENIMYVMNYGLQVALSRALFSIPSHACFGIIMGYYLGLSRVCKENDASDSLVMKYCAFFFPFLFHGFYDFLLNFDDNIIHIMFVIYVFLMYSFAIYLIFKLYKLDSKGIKNRKKELPVLEVKPKTHKNIYYDTLYKIDNSNQEVVNTNKENNNTSVQTNWKNAESNNVIYNNDKIEMKMFRDDK